MDKYFFNTIADLKLATGLTKYQQEKAINHLKKLKLVDVKIKGLPARRYFRINLNMVNKYIEQGKRKRQEEAESVGGQQLARNLTTGWKVSCQQEVKKPAGNNTDLNNTNLNKTKEKKDKNGRVCNSTSLTSSLPFAEYKKTRMLNEVTVEAIDYYLKRYKKKMKKGHPWLKKEQWDRVVENIEYNEAELFCDLDWLKIIINKYFEEEFKGHKCDYNINHFVTGKIMELRSYEADRD